MHRDRTLSLGAASGAAALAASMLLACGGPQQRGDDAGDCPRIRPPMTAAALEAAAACHAETASDASAQQCRDGIDLAATATPTALADLARCVMRSGERTDGAWLADMMASVGGDPERIAALASVFEGPFSPSTHGVTFTASLDDTTQHEIGAALPSMSAGARDGLISLVLAYGVEPLAGYCAPFAGDLDTSDPAVVVFAERIAGGDDELGEFERRLLLETGVWTAQDALECYAGDDPRCRGWQGESPLEVFADASFLDIGLPSTPAAALRILRSPDVDPASARGIAAFIGGAEYDNRSALLPSMMLDMTDEGFRPEIRLAIAQAATAPMCEYTTMRDYLLRAQTSDPNRFDDPDAPWPTFVRACSERHWDADALAHALGAGSWLGVPRATFDALVDRLADLTADASCDELRAVGQAAYEATPWVITRGTAIVIAAQVGGDRCAAGMRNPVERIATSSAEHPEARLAAYAWLRSQGDSAGCRRIDTVLDWYHEDYAQGPGRWAEENGAALRAACR